MKDLFTTTFLIVFSFTIGATGQLWVSNLENGDDKRLTNNILKLFCVDINGYPALNRSGFAWSYLDSTVEIRVGEDGKPIRCMTKKEYESFFGEPFDPQLSYFEEN